MTEMSATISDVAVNAENTAASTNKVVDRANQNDKNMQVTSKTISQVSENISTANELVRDLPIRVLWW